MTKYERDYSKIENDLEKDQAAIKYIQDYLGPKAWTMLMTYIKDGVPCKQIDRELCFCGVQGYPIFAFLKMYKPLEEYQAWYNSLPD
jgi:hypothetical protein